jgi:hypothetical protein
MPGIVADPVGTADRVVHDQGNKRGGIGVLAGSAQHQVSIAYSGEARRGLGVGAPQVGRRLSQPPGRFFWSATAGPTTQHLRIMSDRERMA